MNEKLVKKEQQKYKNIWSKLEYSFYSNEAITIYRVIDWLSKKPVRKVLVVGCGEGFGIHRLTLSGFDSYGLDIINVLKFPEYKSKFIEGTIWKMPYKDLKFDACIAIDVLEHIPEEKIKNSIGEINRISKFFYFNIACRPDTFGKMINDRLHMTVKPPDWWLKMLFYNLKIESYHGGEGNLTIKGRRK